MGGRMGQRYILTEESALGSESMARSMDSSHFFRTPWRTVLYCTG